MIRVFHGIFLHRGYDATYIIRSINIDAWWLQGVFFSPFIPGGWYIFQETHHGDWHHPPSATRKKDVLGMGIKLPLFPQWGMGNHPPGFYIHWEHPWLFPQEKNIHFLGSPPRMEPAIWKNVVELNKYSVAIFVQELWRCFTLYHSYLWNPLVNHSNFGNHLPRTRTIFPSKPSIYGTTPVVIFMMMKTTHYPSLSLKPF